MSTTTYSWTETTPSFFMHGAAAGNQSQPAITSLADGSYFGAWTTPTGGFDVNGRIIGENGFPPASEFTVNPTMVGGQFDPSVAVLTNGSVVVVYTDDSPLVASGGLVARLYDDTGQATDLHLFSYPGYDYRSVDVTALADGGFAVTWVWNPVAGANSPNGYQNNVRAFNSDGSVRDDTSVMGGLSDSSVSSVAGLAGPDGGFVVAWDDPNTAGDTQVRFQRFDDSANKVGNEVSFDSNGSINRDIQVAGLPDGGFVVAYADNGWAISDGTEITVRVFNGDGSVRNGPIRANTLTVGDQDKASLTVLSNGFFAVSWSDGNETQIQAFDPDGVKVGSNKTMTTGTIEAEIAGLSAGFVANVRSSTVADAGGGNSIRSSVMELSRTITGDDTDETLTGDSLRDIIDGGPGSDTIDGGGGDDVIRGGLGAETIHGGAGDDFIEGGNHRDTIFGDDGDDTIFAWNQQSPNSGQVGSETLNGGAGNDSIWGSTGDDMIDGGTGVDSMRGGNDDDWYFVDNIADVVVETAGQGTADRVLASASYTLGVLTDVEILSTTDDAGTGAINLAGNYLPNTIYGNAGANTLDGKGGIDTLVGFGGDDWYYVDNALDTVSEAVGQGNDRVLSAVNFTLAAGQEIEKLTTADNGSTAAIKLTGNELVNIIYGNAGANTLDGKGGGDDLVGLEGDDWYYVDNALDTVSEAVGQGNDRVLSAVDFTLAAGQEIEKLTTANNGSTAAIKLTGNELPNTIYGNAGANTLDGKAGPDTLVGLGGDDWFFVDNAGDVVFEATGEGTDQVLAGVDYMLGAGVYVETLSTTSTPGAANLNLSGNEFGNTIIGNAGSNALKGGLGKDVLYGGDGIDAFAFNTAPNAMTNVDTILDFSVADDDIVLFGGIFTGIAAGVLSAAAFVTGATAADASDRIVYNSATGGLYHDADGLGGAAQVQFASVTAGLALTNADFLVV